MTAKSNLTLAVVRCGDTSLHTSWALGSRKFDVGVSYFGDDKDRRFPEAGYIHHSKGGKWDGLFTFFRQFPEVIDAYDYFWLPDDDISATTEDLNRLFEIGTANNFQLYQPALDEYSYYSHLVCLQHPSFTFRYTNFVEIMVPVVSREVLKRTLAMLENTRSGFGIDFVWPKIAAEISGSPFKGTAIIDSVSVRHTRPVGGSLHKFISEVGGKSALDEMNTSLSHVGGAKKSAIHGVAVPRIRITSGVDKAGRHLKGMRLAAGISADLINRHNNVVQPINKFAAIKHALKAIR